jgi:UPF0755 protein
LNNLVKKFNLIEIKNKIVNFFAIFSTIIFIFMMSSLSIIMYFNAPNSFQKQDALFVVKRGATFKQVVDKLYDEKIIAHPKVFLYLSRIIGGYNPKVHYGEYFFEKNSSYYKLLHKMVRGFNSYRKLTIAEGLSNSSIFDIVEHAPGLIGNIDVNWKRSLKEGSLMPETYFYSYNDSKMTTLRRMQFAMSKAIDELWPKRDHSIPLKTKEEALILASIVEKETGLESERPKVASVFINRLRKNIKLQSDPTVIYSFTNGNKKLERPIRMSDLKNNSLFNTYNIYGLPPTAICNPGLASIKAVLNPPVTDYIYFVATNNGNGGHHFSANIYEHNFYVIKYRKSLKNATAKNTTL